MNERYRQSQQLLARAQAVIPLGAQTFSKSATQFPAGVSPYFMDRAEGAYSWDVDGNRYLDLNNALAAITLGHADRDVNRAVAAQLQKGTVFSLSSVLEAEVAERIAAMVPCAEMVRFGKNGSDATSGALRLARAVTGRDYVAVCGYHGWHDWYIGCTSKDKGVPPSVKALTLPFGYNDIASLQRLYDQYPGAIAAVIMEPMNTCYPQRDFLQQVRNLTARHGSVLVFDETVTGFRLAEGGAQQLFGVTPDLATFGKGLANGFPLSAVAGKAELMREMENIFFSFTFGGETLSLAASKAALDKLRRCAVPATIAAVGGRLQAGVETLIDRFELRGLLRMSGHPAWSFLLVSGADEAETWLIKTYLMQETLARNVLTLGSHNLSYAFSGDDLATLLHCYEEVFAGLRRGLDSGDLAASLRCRPLAPLFKVR